MGRRKSDIQGQMSFCICTENYVVQSNVLISGRQSVGLSAAKILRAVIMQVKPDDEELIPYHIPVGQLADLINANRSTLTHDIDRLTDEILTHPIVIKDYDVKKDRYRFVKIPWVEFCEYSSTSGLSIKLNNLLKPHIIQLLKQYKYTQYVLQDILQMKSAFAIRIYEVLLSRIKTKTLPKDGKDIELTIDDIRTATDTIDKFARYSNLKKKVIDKAVEEIQRCTLYKVTYTEKKTGKQVTSIIFHLTMQYY